MNLTRDKNKQHKLLTLVLGGSKSGKSQYAQNLSETYPAPRLFIATARALDEEMKQKIERHKKQRGPGWCTIEEPLEIANAVEHNSNKYSVILIDCITLWISNMILKREVNQDEFEIQVNNLCKALEKALCPVIVVSNEVGMGIVPDTPLSRKFREYSGLANQQIAKTVDRVTLCVAGLPLHLK